MKYLLNLVWDYFKKFSNDFAVFALTYGRIAFISVGLSVVIPSFLHIYLGMPHSISMIITRILLTITPIFPTLYFVKTKNEDYNPDEYSMDLCFTAWIVTVVFAWWII